MIIQLHTQALHTTITIIIRKNTCKIIIHPFDLYNTKLFLVVSVSWIMMKKKDLTRDKTGTFTGKTSQKKKNLCLFPENHVKVDLVDTLKNGNGWECSLQKILLHFIWNKKKTCIFSLHNDNRLWCQHISYVTLEWHLLLIRTLEQCETQFIESLLSFTSYAVFIACYK